MLMDVLKPIDIVVKQLQSSEEYFISALEVMNGVKDDINSKRENITSENVKKMTEEVSKNVKSTAGLQHRPKRNNAVPSNFDDFVIIESVPSENNRRPNIQIFSECLDLLSSEFIRRFSTQNILLWNDMSVLSPSSNNYLHVDTLKPLFEYAEQIPVLKEFYVKENLSAKDLEAE